MGRSTHNKHTRTNAATAKEYKINTKVLSSIKELKENTDSTNTIPHVEILSSNDSISDIYNALNDFSSLAQKIVGWYDDNELIIKKPRSAYSRYAT